MCNHNCPQILQRAQSTINMWEAGLQATGGAIEPSKTTWYLLKYQWDNSQWRYKPSQEATGTLTV